MDNASFLTSATVATVTVAMETVSPPAALRWGAIGLGLIVVVTVFGNVLLCLAVMTERRLRNMTNYFLASLAVADLLVAVVVMPIAVVVEIHGQFCPVHVRNFSDQC